MALIRFEPARELASLQGEMNQLFSSFFGDTAPAGGNGSGRSGGGRHLDRARGQRPHDLRRAQARGEDREGGLLPDRARLRQVRAFADAPRGRRRGCGQGRLPQRRARGRDPQARAAQAPQGGDRRRRQAGRDRGRRDGPGGHREELSARGARSGRGPARCGPSLLGSQTAAPRGGLVADVHRLTTYGRSAALTRNSPAPSAPASSSLPLAEGALRRPRVWCAG
jgi:hypothetical protein